MTKTSKPIKFEAYFTVEADSKIMEVVSVVVDMVKRKQGLFKSAPRLIGLLEWFWESRKKDQFEIWRVVDGIKSEFIIDRQQGGR